VRGPHVLGVEQGAVSDPAISARSSSAWAHDALRAIDSDPLADPVIELQRAHHPANGVSGRRAEIVMIRPGDGSEATPRRLWGTSASNATRRAFVAKLASTRFTAPCGVVVCMRSRVVLDWRVEDAGSQWEYVRR